ncbi:MAG: hypothetical protein ACETWQ_08770 [Phycisphaerae bacterium]
MALKDTQRLRIIVIDKDVFQGIQASHLCSFAKNHCLVLSQHLLYECLTATYDGRQHLMQRFEDTISAGAYIGPLVRGMLQKEGNSLQPYGFLPDLAMTSEMRRAIHKNRIRYDRGVVAGLEQREKESGEFLLDLTRSAASYVEQKNPRGAEVARKYQGSRLERLKVFLEFVDTVDMHEVACQQMGHLTHSPEDFCLSPEWVSWQYLRLITVLTFEYGMHSQKGTNMRPPRAHHDVLDVEYVVLLSRADGILTRDKKLVTPLAQAAFPEKDVFFSLDEVPDEYLCHWS